MTDSIILIGMPGAGKSTVGVLLAKKLGLSFIDTDIEIQNRAGKMLQKILNESDYKNLCDLEEQVLLSIDPSHCVVATGGSAVYSQTGMMRLKQAGTIVYLKTLPQTLQNRIHNYDSRGIARRPEQSFDDLFAERTPLYDLYAEITLDCDDQNPDHLSTLLANVLNTKKPVQT